MESMLLLPSRPVTSIEEYADRGGGAALRAFRDRGADWVLDELDRSGLRGRGGAGFPAGRKWRSVASGRLDFGDRYVVANGAEGEPGTFKDRPLLRANPYQVIEGLAIAADLLRAREAFIVVKASFEPEIVALERALEQMAAADLVCDAPITLIGGPEEYLLGEETAMLEVIEGNDPMPRWLPPYQHGLFATTPQEGWAGGSRQGAEVTAASNPTLASNVETFANVPLILRHGADWYRGIGTAETPGPLLCTVVGDVVRAGYGEVEPGTPLRDVIEELGGGLRPDRTAKVVLSGVSNRVLTGEHLEAPVSYEGLTAAGGGLGSAGFIVYDDTRSALSIARWVSRFLYVESCGQCRACKYGCGEVTRRLDAVAERRGTLHDVEVIGERLRGVTDQNRCFVGEEEQRVISSLLVAFPDDFASELEVSTPVETLPIPKILDIQDGVAAYDEWAAYKQPDWTYVVPPDVVPPRRRTFVGTPGR
jgi:NADH:ubiquinone oxidoreductase subunit F (NADH-binding)